ncbi:hypothetical protein [Maricaulis sp.]|uniref:hypothetical protein n=1 Tax=Maricaulis sp. TaxID=1486257 RepID=UPI000C37BA13|nr:hypothetical protein [Maricaulis sp.]MAC90343.1 hypothetical protein [Maricaulis sp.]
MRLLLLASFLVLASCAEGDGYVALPGSDQAWTSYVAEGLIPASLPRSARLESIYQPCCDLNGASVNFNLDEPANLDWLGPLEPVARAVDTGEAYGQVRGPSAVEIAAYGEVCDSGLAWRYLIVTSGFGTAQQLASDAGVCAGQETSP